MVEAEKVSAGRFLFLAAVEFWCLAEEQVVSVEEPESEKALLKEVNYYFCLKSFK